MVVSTASTLVLRVGVASCIKLPSRASKKLPSVIGAGVLCVDRPRLMTFERCSPDNVGGEEKGGSFTTSSSGSQAARGIHGDVSDDEG